MALLVPPDTQGRKHLLAILCYHCLFPPSWEPLKPKAAADNPDRKSLQAVLAAHADSCVSVGMAGQGLLISWMLSNILLGSLVMSDRAVSGFQKKGSLGFGRNLARTVLFPEKSEQAAAVINTWQIMPSGGLAPDSPVF